MTRATRCAECEDCLATAVDWTIIAITSTVQVQKRQFRSFTSTYTNNHFVQLRSAGDLDCCFMANPSGGKPPGPRIMRKLWSNSRERTWGNENRQDEDSSYTKGIEVLLRDTARKGYPDPENVNNPMIDCGEGGIAILLTCCQYRSIVFSPRTVHTGRTK